ncbi:MAG: hypothetical protein QOJ12_1642 [Thermoleophilales bacterium]|jgi:gas vesicle protein|nr:hypothetical protein [Thermoleophilales bacterium]
MGQDPRTIREDIEQTRERMGDTVEALAYKSDVKSRAKDSVNSKVDAVKERIVGTAESVNDATPGTDDIKQGAQRAVGLAQENPLGLAIGAAAVGFVAGLLLPSTRVEDEQLGQVSDQVKDQVRQTAQVAVEHGKEAAQEAAQAAAGAARETGQQHAQEAKEDLQHQVQQAQQGVSR